MGSWINVHDRLPDEAEPVTVRVHGVVRPDYYRIDGHWYSLLDLDRWQMNTSPYWTTDRAWYLLTEQVEAWRAP